MACTDCENHQRYVKDAEDLLNEAQRSVRRLDLLTYSQVAEADNKASMATQALAKAKRSQRAHRKKCAEARLHG